MYIFKIAFNKIALKFPFISRVSKARKWQIKRVKIKARRRERTQARNLTNSQKILPQQPKRMIRSKIRFHQTDKKLSLVGSSEKIYIKWFVLAGKSVSTTQNEAFVEKYVSTIRQETASSNKKIEENNFHQHENIFILKLVHRNLNNGFQQQKKALNKRILFPLDRK